MGLQWVMHNATVANVYDYEGPLYTPAFTPTVIRSIEADMLQYGINQYWMRVILDWALFVAFIKQHRESRRQGRH